MRANDRFSCYLVGDDSLLIRCAEILIERGHSIRGISTSVPTIADWAASHGLPLVALVGPGASPEAREPVDYLFSVANLQLLPTRVLALAERLAVNFHDGPLPRFAGVSATSWAIIDGVTEYGVTWHVIEERPDSGDILKQRRFPVDADESALTLNLKCYAAATESFLELIREFEGSTASRFAQDQTARTYFSRRRRPSAAGVLRFDEPAERLNALVRALDFGPYPNRLAKPKIRNGTAALIVEHAAVLGERSAAMPGTIVRVCTDGIDVATGTDDIRLNAFRSIVGEPLTVAEAATYLRLQAGDSIPRLTEQEARDLQTLTEEAGARETDWIPLLADPRPVVLPFSIKRDRHGEPAVFTQAVNVSYVGWAESQFTPSELLAGALALFFGRVAQQPEFDVWLSANGSPAVFTDIFSPWRPVRMEYSPRQSFTEAIEKSAQALRDDGCCSGLAFDIFGRHPALTLARDSSSGGVGILTGDERLATTDAIRGDLDLAIAVGEQELRWCFDAKTLEPADVLALQQQFLAFVSNGTQSPEGQVAHISLLGEVDRDRVVQSWNATSRPYAFDEPIHRTFENRAARSPMDVAVIGTDETLNYQELNGRANQLARHLQSLGVGPDVLVAISQRRSTAMLVSILATLKAGGAYLPLDPDYPRARTTFMLEDSNAQVVLTDSSRANEFPGETQIFDVDSEWATLAALDDSNPESTPSTTNLAYVIYTSGSTGRPKGVMVEHRNVQNFFAGMDDRLGPETGTWLAVTSLSFDISVLELLWTLTRGFKVVLHNGGVQGLVASPPEPDRRALAFSLFFFSSLDADSTSGKYDLLLEGARFADSNGFEAVWTPERHFHAFGGLFPNPSVTSAAIAAVTKSVAIRAGSCVLPLHSPIRVAEEWSVVDNISGGRVGISFASGWQPEDFVLAPANYARAKDVMRADIETVRRLWRGDAVSFPGHDGTPVSVRIQPQPIQAELPVWITSAGNEDTFRLAGDLGVNVLTHLLGQSLEDVAARVAIYRDAWAAAGHPGEGHVTLMMHTFVGESDDAVRAAVRGPMVHYLRSSVGLIKEFAWSFPAFQHKRLEEHVNSDILGSLSHDELQSLLEYAFERYYESSGLFGTPERCASIIEDVRSIGVDEVACLVDFGVAPGLVLKSLESLSNVRSAVTEERREGSGLADAIVRHNVTHLQCTPSMATILMTDERTKRSMGRLEVMLVGGETLPVPLANELSAAVRGRVVNMYGPTETTIWSTTYEVNDERGSGVPIGRPIANTTIYVVDAHGGPVPVGVVGDLLIGGDGVVRGYLNRPELTDERFVPDNFAQVEGMRLYRTGDIARYRPDGVIEFLGRSDHQVKLHGHRIELGEIEAAIAACPSVREVVVIAREDTPGDVRLVAYFVSEAGTNTDVDTLRERVAAALPAIMIPRLFVELPSFPLTPNAKIDRQSLPKPGVPETAARAESPAPRGVAEERIAAVWSEVLDARGLGRSTTFFDLGGNSLLVVRAHRLLVQQFPNVKLTDLFRFTTIESLAGFLESATTDAGGPVASGRADARREAAFRRRSGVRT